MTGLWSKLINSWVIPSPTWNFIQTSPVISITNQNEGTIHEEPKEPNLKNQNLNVKHVKKKL